MKIVSWNLNGLTAVMKSGSLGFLKGLGPEESFQRMLEHFRALFPQTPEGELRKMLG